MKFLIQNLQKFSRLSCWRYLRNFYGRWVPEFRCNCLCSLGAVRSCWLRILLRIWFELKCYYWFNLNYWWILVILVSFRFVFINFLPRVWIIYLRFVIFLQKNFKFLDFFIVAVREVVLKSFWSFYCNSNRRIIFFA